MAEPPCRRGQLAKSLRNSVNRRLFLAELGNRPGGDGARLTARCDVRARGSRCPRRSGDRRREPGGTTGGGLPGLPHFAAKVKRVIYLFQSGAPVADRPVRLQAAICETARHRAARFDPDGPADHHHDLGSEEPAGGAVALPSSPSTARAARG